jgi:hypothetical protein
MNLPEYEPSDKIWQNIEAKLNKETFKKALKELPEYEPKDELWTGISGKLNKPKIRYIKWAAAASIVLAFGLYFSLKNNGVTYTKQALNPDLVLTEKDNSQYGYEEIKKICKEDKIVCEKPEFKALETELEDLNTASNDLKDAIGKYNTEPELIAQLAEIENQKSEIISKMAAQI